MDLAWVMTSGVVPSLDDDPIMQELSEVIEELSNSNDQLLCVLPMSVMMIKYNSSWLYNIIPKVGRVHNPKILCMVNTGVMHSIEVLSNSCYNICTGDMHSLEILYNRYVQWSGLYTDRADTGVLLMLGLAQSQEYYKV